MISRLLNFEFFKRHSEYGVLFIRLAVGFHLFYGTQDNVFSYPQMEEFAKFLAARGVPASLFSAFLSAYAQFICGILFIIGAFTRPAAVVMIINFIAAIVIAHIGDTYRNTFPALMMLAAALFFLVHGAGALSFDEWWERKRGARL